MNDRALPNLTPIEAIDAAHHLHPFSDHHALRRERIRVIERADGPYVWDADGNRILDGMAGLWCVNVGYGREELVEAAAEQMRAVPYYNAFFKTTTGPTARLAERIAALAPSHMNQMFFGSSGSEANDTAIRVVRQYWALKGKPEKQIIISRRDAYHGSTIGAVSMGGMGAMHEQGGARLPGFRHVMAPYHFENAKPGESEEAFGLRTAKAVEDAILDAGPENVAAFVGEPIQGAGGVKIPPPNYWAEAQAICKRYDVLLMLDEVITGFGRTGAWFAAESMGIVPDTMVVAKAITSGYQPLSATILSDEVAGVLEGEGAGEFFHGYTYSGHPVACAVALANIDIIDREGLIERVRDETGPYLLKALHKAIGDHTHVGEIRGFGLLAAVEIVKDRETKERFSGGGAAATRLRDTLIRNGLMMRAVGDTMILSPPLIWTKATVDEAVETIATGLGQVRFET